jgi:hypothetical protein
MDLLIWFAVALPKLDRKDGDNVESDAFQQKRLMINKPLFGPFVVVLFNKNGQAGHC